MRLALLSCLAGLLLTAPAGAGSLGFDFTASIFSASLRDPAQDALLVDGGVLTGRVTYSDPPSRQVGGTYFYDAGLETFEIATPTGFGLTLGNRIVDVGTVGATDHLFVQSFVSEDPNGWNMILDLSATGWRGGDTSLPTVFPDSFDSAYLSAYFLDEWDTVQSIDATILSVRAAPVSLPPTGLLLCGALSLGLAWRRRAARRSVPRPTTARRPGHRP